MEYKTKSNFKNLLFITLFICALAFLFLGTWFMKAGGTKNARFAAAESDSDVWTGSTEPFTEGTGTSGNPYKISTGEQLAYLVDVINNNSMDEEDGISFNSATKYYALENNIVLNDITGWDDRFGETGFDGSGLTQWTPIGNSINNFAANFNGQNYVVKGIFIYTGSSQQGLFGYVNGGKISNLGVEQSFIRGRTSIGGVAGLLDNNSTITNCHNAGVILGVAGNSIGGVAGDVSADSGITGCYNSGRVYGSSNYTGGVAGKVSGSVTNCYNTGNVSGTDRNNNIGGIVGLVVEGSIAGCYNTGNVSSVGSGVGGVAGYVSAGSGITSCYNSGNVSGSSNYTGGVAGMVNDSSLTNCHNIGVVSGNALCVGGVVGRISHALSVGGGSVANCYNTGAVTGEDDYVGGIVGLLGDTPLPNGSSVTNCYNTGAVSGKGNSVGGVAGGSSSDGNAINCYNTGAVTGEGDYVGGVAGSIDTGGIVANCYYLSGTEQVIGDGSGATAVFNASGIITENFGITDISITINETTLSDALNAWVDGNNPAGLYYSWTDAVFPIFGQLPVINAQEPVIIVHPSDRTAVEGGTATLTVTAESPDGGTLSYQWYKNTINSVTGGALINGAVNLSFIVSTDVVGTIYYYCVVTNTITENGDGGEKSVSITSNIAKVTVNAAADSTQDNADIAAAKLAIEGAIFTEAQANANTKEAARAAVETVIAGLSLNGVTTVIKDGAFTAAVAGTKENPNGTNGSYTFTVLRIKGTGAEVETATLTLAITATAYTDDNADIAAAKLAIEGATFAAAQANVNTKEAARAAAETVIAGLSLNGVTTVIKDGAFTAAVAGTKENPNGTNGSYTFTVLLNKGTGAEVETATLTLAITATAYTDNGGGLSGGLSDGAIAAIVIGSAATVALAGFAVFWFVKKRKN